MFFGLNESYMRAQDLKIGGFGTEFRDEAIGIGLRTQKYIKNMGKKHGKKRTRKLPSHRPSGLILFLQKQKKQKTIYNAGKVNMHSWL